MMWHDGPDGEARAEAETVALGNRLEAEDFRPKA